MFFSQGIVLYLDPLSGGGAATSTLIWCFFNSVTVASCFLILTFPLTYLAAVRPTLKKLVLFQIGISFIYASGSLIAIIRGVYADNYHPSGGIGFIYNDQIPIIFLLIIHTTAAIVQLDE